MNHIPAKAAKLMRVSSYIAFSFCTAAVRSEPFHDIRAQCSIIRLRLEVGIRNDAR